MAHEVADSLVDVSVVVRAVLKVSWLEHVKADHEGLEMV